MAGTGAQASEVTSPTGSSASVTRYTAVGDEVQLENITYVIENKGSSVKFEDAPVGLGEEGARQRDVFELTVNGAGSTLTAITKAATASDSTTLQAGESAVDDLGFEVELAEVNGEQYKVFVTSVDPPHALSHVTFRFPDDGTENTSGDDGSSDDSPSNDGGSDGGDADYSYDNVVYGIDRSSDQLLRYSFPEDKASVVGKVKDTSGEVVSGIEAGAYIPGSQNMFAFSHDAESNQTWLRYLNLETAESVRMEEPVGAGRMTGAAAVRMAGRSPAWRVFGVQELTQEEAEQVEFKIEGDTVVTQEAVSAKVEVLGAAITAGGEYDVPVTTRIGANGESHEPFGAFADVGKGNVNDADNPRQFVLPEEFPAGAPINVSARSWLKSWRGGWYEHMKVSQNHRDENMIVLRDGDTVPDIDPFMNQSTINAFLSEHINTDTNKVTLSKNQAIYLFELGTTNHHSDAADFQDLVVLVTLAKDRETLTKSPADGKVAELIEVDPKTGASTFVMALDRQYDSLATRDGNTFYATKGKELYRINKTARSEEPLTTMGDNQVAALDHAGWKLTSFDMNNDRMVPLNSEVREQIPWVDIGMQNLGTMVFGDPETDPTGKPDSYD